MQEPLEVKFLRLLQDSKERVLYALENNDPDFQVLDKDFSPVASRAERLVKTGRLTSAQAQEAPVVVALAQLQPELTLDSLITSLGLCLDVKTTAKGSLMELLLAPEHSFADLYRRNGQGIFQLQTLLMAAQPVIPRPTKKPRTHTEYRASYWKVSLAYVLSQLAWDDMERSSPFAVAATELFDRTVRLARPFGLQNSDLLVAGHNLFLLDVFANPSRTAPEGLTMEYVVNELTSRQ